MRFHPVHGQDFSVICEDFGTESEALEAIAHALDAGRSLVLTRAKYDRAADENGVVIVEDRQRRDGPVLVTPVSSGRGISRGEPAQPPGPRPGTVDDGASMAGGVCRRPTYSATAHPGSKRHGHPGSKHANGCQARLTDLWLAAPGAVMSSRYAAPGYRQRTACPGRRDQAQAACLLPVTAGPPLPRPGRPSVESWPKRREHDRPAAAPRGPCRAWMSLLRS
jgi:hypothetical protein